jgi:hypothetical protein
MKNPLHSFIVFIYIQIRKVGKRNDLSEAEAEKVVKTIWPEKIILKQ